MKSFFAVTALVGLVAAQNLTSLPECGQACINGMLLKASSLGCPPVTSSTPNAVCLCQNVAFENGVRDCVTESCPSGTNDTSIIAYGLAYCSSALASATPISTSYVLSTVTSGSNTITTTVSSTTILGVGAVAQSTAITTKPIVTTETTSGNTITTTIGSTTIYSPIPASSASSAVSSKLASASSAASSAAASASSAVSSVASSASSAASSVASSAASAASSASSSAGGLPMVTVAAQAFAGIAGVAAVLAL